MKAFLILALLLTSCATRSKFEVLSDSGGIAQVRLTRSEFNAASAAMESADNARNDFIESARLHAINSGTNLESINIVDAKFGSNWFNGRYSTRLTGWLKHGEKPQREIAFRDTSKLLFLADAKQRLEDGMQRFTGALAAGSLAASATMQQSMMIQSQNASINRLSNSIDNNTNAINALPRDGRYMRY